jgi:hypothetical protein
MGKRRSIALLVFLLGGLLLAPVAQANIPAASYAIDWHVIGGGAGPEMSNGDYGLNSTLGQTAIGWSENGHGLGSGYWYGLLRLHKVFLPLVLRDYP